MADQSTYFNGPTITLDKGLHELVYSAAGLFPDKVAVWYDGGSEGQEAVKYTYKQLISMAQWVEHLLRQEQCCHQVIGILCLDHPAMPVWITGILSVPASFLPLSMETSGAWIRNLVKRLSMCVILADTQGLQIIESQIPDLIEAVCDTKSQTTFIAIDSAMPTYMHLHIVKLNTQLSATMNPRVINDLAYVITTSGTTGCPKIVKVPHRCIVPNIIHISEIYKLTSHDIVYQASPATFDPSIVEIFSTLHCGATLLVLPENTRRRQEQLASTLYHHNVTVIQATPTLVSSMGALRLSAGLLSVGSRLRVLALGGERCPSCATIDSWRGPGNNTQVINLYGITEVSSWAAYHLVTDSDRDSSAIPLGMPLYNTTISVKYCSSRSQGKMNIGLVSIGGSSRVCYLDDECDDDVTKVMRNTGDLVREEDGSLYFVGREDEQIKRQGKRVNPIELENVCEQLSGVYKVAVVYNHPHLLMFIQLSVGGHSIDGTATLTDTNIEQIVEAHLLEQLPVYYLPDSIIVVQQIPFTHHGKVDKTKLVRDYQRQQLRDRICTLWKRYTYQPLESVIAPTDKFLECGGNSISAVRLMNTMETKLLGYSLRGNQLLDVILNGTLQDLVSDFWKEIHETESTKIDDRETLINISTENLSIPNKKGLLLSKNVNSSSSVNVNNSLKSSIEAKVQHRDMPNHGDFTKTYTSGYDSQYQRTKMSNHKTDCEEYIQAHKRPRHELAVREETTPLFCTKGALSRRVVNNIDILSVSRMCQIQSHGLDHMTRIDSDDVDTICLPSVQLTEDWSFNMGKCVDSSPLLVVNRCGGGRVYIGSHCKRCTLAALDLATGTIVWSVGLSTRIEAAPCLSKCGRYVIVGAYDHNVYIYDAESGAQYWTYTTEGQVKDTACVHPTNGRVYVGSHDQTVYCLDIQVKSCVWKLAVDGSVFASPCITTEPHHLYVATTRGNIYCMEPDTGIILWNVSLASPVFSSPALTPGGICVATVGHMIIWITHQGKQVWSYRCHGPVFSSPCVYVDSPISTSALMSCKRSSQAGDIGDPDQSSDTEEHFAEVCSKRSSQRLNNDTRARITDDSYRCIVGDHSNSVTCLNSSGRLLWRHKMASPVYSSPCVFSNPGRQRLVVACSTVGEVHVLDLETGTKLGELTTPGGEIFSSPVVWDNRLVFGCRDNNVYCLIIKQKFNNFSV